MFDYTSIYILTIISLVIMISIIKKSHYIEKRKHMYYVLAIISNIFVHLGYVGRDLSQQFQIRPLAYFANTLTYIFAPLSLFFLILASAKKINLPVKICCILEVISIAIAVTTPFTGAFFTISPNAVYSRGPLYGYNEFLGIFLIIMWAIYTFTEYKFVELTDKMCLVQMFILQIFAVILQGINSTYKVIYICAAFVMMIYYAFIVEVTGKYDNMTGVRNRLYYNTYLNRMNKSDRYSVILYDANGLKHVNDNFGHEAGDKLICAVASAIANGVGKKGSVYRIGGDEFVAILKSDNEDLAQSIDMTVNKLLAETDIGIGIELSAASGIAVHASGEEHSETMKRADEKMYESKNKYYALSGKERRK